MFFDRFFWQNAIQLIISEPKYLSTHVLLNLTILVFVIVIGNIYVIIFVLVMMSIIVILNTPHIVWIIINVKVACKPNYTKRQSFRRMCYLLIINN